MLTLPDIRNVPLSIPLPAVCNIAKDMESVTRRIHGLNRALCKGKPSGRQAPTLMAASQSVTAELKAAVEALLSNEGHVNPLISRYKEDGSLSIQYGTYYNFFSTQTNKPITAITLEPEIVYYLDGSFIKDIKQHRPALYPLIRLIVTLVAGLQEVTTVNEMHYMMEDRITQDIDEAEDDETKQATQEQQEMMKRELKEYKAHIKTEEMSLETVTNEIRRLHKRHSHLMSTDENLFVITAIGLAEALANWNRKLTAATDYDDYYDDGSRHHITSFFYLTWGDNGMSAEYMEDFLNGSGELSAPQVILQIKDRKSLESAVQAVRFYVLLQTLMAAGNQLWT